jgi:hypothetical protein
MVQGYSAEAIANLNSTSPLAFSDTISPEDLARDLDLFANTTFFDFAPLDPLKPEHAETTSSFGSLNDPDSLREFNFLSGLFSISQLS